MRRRDGSRWKTGCLVIRARQLPHAHRPSPGLLSKGPLSPWVSRSFHSPQNNPGPGAPRCREPARPAGGGRGGRFAAAGAPRSPGGRRRPRPRGAGLSWTRKVTASSGGEPRASCPPGPDSPARPPACPGAPAAPGTGFRPLVCRRNTRPPALPRVAAQRGLS